MTSWEVCATSWVNVVLRLGSLGYPLHGHDVQVTVCVKGDRKALLLYDIEALKGRLEATVRELNYADLAAALGKEEAAIEDLVEYICAKLRGSLEAGLDLSLVEARIPSGVVRLHC